MQPAPSVPESTAFTFQVLGPLEVRNHARPVDVGSGKLSQLLALLLIEPNRPRRRDLLIDQLWNGAPPTSAVATLQSHVYRLRGLLTSDGRSPVESLAGGYRLVVPAHGFDLAQFEELVRTGRKARESGATERAADTLRQALDVWAGEAFAGVDLEVVQLHAAGLQSLRLQIVEECVAAELALGRQSDVIPELENLIGEHSLRESLWALLLQALARSGRAAEALSRYGDLERVLDDELGVRPGPLVSGVRDRIVERAPASGEPRERLRYRRCTRPRCRR
ncbi:AfsR/SARP family transcriptional regulator [Kribbella solani]|uniref:DNA-binding SARP family transcriptional activator n=1 Tax=Kribbella solani TaxID=236067 RepID=A0A841DKK8_9ACTN|nr:AfsR/SARP family transcriptional regulator [Kribbella solani]MBB5977316.1 DNA-binding SARP family transcriptional activator [Kribbella solani]